MKEIIFATGNLNKLKEVKLLLGKDIKVLSLKNVGFTDDIEETEDTIEGNSMLKAKYIFDLFQKPVLAEDTGLEVEALNGEPGVFSARYAGANCSSEDNMKLLLKRMENISKRNARFKTVATFINSFSIQKQYLGVVNGKILFEKKGSEGFGYDPIFQAEGFSKSFAEMSDEEKALISHRGIAIKKFAKDFLANLV